MNESDKILEENGSDINLRQFIYLDRYRLNSYSSQIADGIVQIRRLSENTANRSIENPTELTREDFQETSSEGEVKLGVAGGKKSNKRNRKTTLKQPGGVTTSNEHSESFSEEKIDYDNAYLILERELKEMNLITEIRGNMPLDVYAPIIKAKGISRFFDWEAISNLFSSDLMSLISSTTAMQNPNEAEELQRQMMQLQFNVMRQVVNIFSIGAITFHAHVGNLNLLASLNPDHLCVTRDQLRAVYVMPGDVEMTIVGFTPNRTLQRTVFPGVAGQINIIDLWGQLVGEVNLVIDPIAIYAETNQRFF